MSEKPDRSGSSVLVWLAVSLLLMAAYMGAFYVSIEGYTSTTSRYRILRGGYGLFGSIHVNQ